MATPLITSVSSTSANGTYTLGQTITITVTFDQIVSLGGAGTPQLTLETGLTDRVVNFTTASGNTVNFAYTVQAGDTSGDLNYLSTSALSLNGATIRNGAAENADLTLPALSSVNSLAGGKAIVVETTPTITSVTSTAANGSYGVGSVIPITVTFDQAVTVTATPTLLLETGAVDRTATYASGTGSNVLTFNYTVQAGDTSADLDYQSLSALVGTIKNGANAVSATLTLPTLGGASSLGGGKAIVIDTAAPTISSVSVPANGVYDTNGQLNFTVNYSEAVTVTGTPRLAITLDTGGTVYANCLSGTGTNALVFRLTATAAMTDMNGIVLGTTLDLNGGTIKDAGGNVAPLTLTGLPSTAGILIANSPPVLGGDLTAAIAEDGSYILTAVDLVAVDPDDSGAGLTFFVSKLNDGTIQVGGKSVTTFTAADLAGGLVSFVHNGSEDTTASFAVKVEDGNEDASVATTSTFTFTVAGVVDIVDGTGKDDVLKGTRNSDMISGFAGDDRLIGFDGDDELIGGKGKDELEGGDGVDTFVFSGKFGYDTIMDFDAKGTDHDIIDMSNVTGIADFADLKKNHLSEHGNDVIITLGKNEIVLENVDIKDLDADDFLF